MSEGPGIKIIRQEDAEYDSDMAAEAVDYTEKPIDDSALTAEMLAKLYAFRISQE